MSKAKIEQAEKNEAYHSANFKPNRKKVLRPPIGCYVMIVIYSLYILLPLYIIIITSMKTNTEASAPIFVWWPSKFDFSGYVKLFTDDDNLLRGLVNTCLYYIPTCILNVFFSAVSAYGFAKMEFAGRSQIFGFLIITMTLPGSVTQSSSRVWMNTLNLSGTAWPLILPALLGGIGQVFFLKQYIAGIPDDLIGAAKIDGMGQIKIFLTLIIPLTLPALLVRVILGFIGSYNDYMGPLIYVLQHDTKWTIQLALKNISDRSPYNNIKMAACVVSMFPLIIVYIFIQDYIIKSTSIGSGLKG